MSKDSIWRMLAGKLLPSFGAADWKALPPSVTKVLTLAVFNVGATLDRRLYLVFELTIIRYNGARPFKHLKVKSKILKSILSLLSYQLFLLLYTTTRQRPFLKGRNNRNTVTLMTVVYCQKLICILLKVMSVRFTHARNYMFTSVFTKCGGHWGVKEGLWG